ncbi:hypothetical protein C0989_010006, partial [Termitomyces sp. Mn162]
GFLIVGGVRAVVAVVGIGIRRYWGVVEVGGVELGGWSLSRGPICVGDSSARGEAGCGVSRASGDGGSDAIGCSGLPVGVTGSIPRGPGRRVFAAIFPITLVDLGNERLVPVVGGLFGREAKDVLDPLGQGTTEGEPEGVVIPAGLIGLSFEPYDEGREAFVVAHSEVEEIFLRLCYGVKDAKLTRELLSESEPMGEYGIVWVEPE